MSKHNSHTQSGGAVVRIVAVVLALVAAAYVTISLVFGSWNPAAWTEIRQGQIKDPAEPDEGDNDNTQGGGLVDVTEENGIKLMSAQIDPADFEENGISPAADTAYTLTASVNANALDKSVIWAVAFQNPSSTWASGKSIADYATIAPTTTNGLTANLTIKQAFGERIVVKVAANLDITINATCNVEYLKKMTSFTATLNPSLAADKTGRLYVGDINNTVSINPTYGTGTVSGTISACKTTFTVHNTTKSRIDTLMTNGNGTSSFFCQSSFSCSGLTFKCPLSVGTIINGGGNNGGAQTLLNNYIYNSGATDTSTSMGYDCCLSSTKYEITYSYGSTYNKSLSWTSNSGIYFNKKGLNKIAVIDDINLDKSEIVVIPT